MAALTGVTAVLAVASLVYVCVNSVFVSRVELWGWTKDSLESGDAKISAEEVEQLSSILDAQTRSVSTTYTFSQV